MRYNSVGMCVYVRNALNLQLINYALYFLHNIYNFLIQFNVRFISYRIPL